jgi:hypothetical protein
MSVYIPSDLFKPLGELLEECIFALGTHGYIEGCDTPRSHPEHEYYWIRLKVATGVDMDGDVITQKLGEIRIYACRNGMKRPILQLVTKYEEPCWQKYENLDDVPHFENISTGYPGVWRIEKLYCTEDLEVDPHNLDETWENQEQIRNGLKERNVDGIFITYDNLRRLFRGREYVGENGCQFRQSSVIVNSRSVI